MSIYTYTPEEGLPNQEFFDKGFPYLCALTAVGGLLPFIIYIGQAYWPSSSEDGACVPWRPPSWTYSSVWVTLPILSAIGMGVAIWKPRPTLRHHIWALASYVISYILTWVFALLWQYTYHDLSKTDAVGIFTWVGLLAVLTAGFAWNVNNFSGILQLPLVVWFVIQFCVGASELSC